MTRELLTAWLLLLLESDASHAYGLRHVLAQQHIDADPGTLHRLLRELENDGWLQSRWLTRATGLRRGLYHVSANGRLTLNELAAALAATRDRHAAFLHAYGHTPNRPQ